MEAQEEINKLKNTLRDICLIADVMVGNGPGAVAAFNGTFKYPERRGNEIRGLPTMFIHMREHAQWIRELTYEAIPELKPKEKSV